MKNPSDSELRCFPELVRKSMCTVDVRKPKLALCPHTPERNENEPQEPISLMTHKCTLLTLCCMKDAQQYEGWMHSEIFARTALVLEHPEELGNITDNKV